MMITRLILPAGVSAVGTGAIVCVKVEAGIGDAVHVSVGKGISVGDSINKVGMLSTIGCFSPHKLDDGAHECIKIEIANRICAFLR
jgi:hypothetical protein